MSDDDRRLIADTLASLERLSLALATATGITLADVVGNVDEHGLLVLRHADQTGPAPLGHGAIGVLEQLLARDFHIAGGEFVDPHAGVLHGLEGKARIGDL